jgi:thiol-disulfide isomerase/thioredoxin
MSEFFKNQWTKYRRKKTTIGIILDFLFFALLIGMIIPDSRKVISSTVIRYTMFQPSRSSDIIFVGSNDLTCQLITPEGEVTYPKQSLGKPIFINFWATWCPPCIAEMPSIQKLYDKYEGRVDFYLISNEELSVMTKDFEKRGFNMPIYKLNGKVSEKFYSRKIPSSFLISPEGKIVMQKHGAADWDGKKVFAIIDKMLETKQ